MIPTMRPRSDPLLPKKRLSPSQLSRIRIEAKASIMRIGGDLFLGNLERQFAAVELSGLRLDRFEQSPPHAASLPLLEHMEIVNVEERSRGKRREAEETRGDSDRPIAVGCARRRSINSRCTFSGRSVPQPIGSRA
jgi:hypothetical protein